MRTRLALTLMVVSMAVVACLRSEHPAATEPVDAFFAKQGLTRSQAWGRHVYDRNCAVCHGAQGHGDGKNAYTLDPAPPDFAAALRTHAPSYWRQVVIGGTASVSRSPLCPAWHRTLSTDDVDSVVAYLDLLSRAPEPKRHRR
jgi:mono/diheme cytochrome c family protein